MLIIWTLRPFIEKILMKFQKTITNRLQKMCLLSLLWLQRVLSLVPVPLSFLLLLSLLLISPFLHAQKGNPRHPGIVGFEKIARLPSTPGTLWPLGDINGDSVDDFATEFYLDTCLRSWQCAQELRIHYGVKGGLPNLKEGFRLTPDELMSKTSIRAVGDWDGKNGLDLCVVLRQYNDTSFGNTEGTYDQISRTIIL